MLDYGFGRCDGHHEMVDFRLRKKPRPERGFGVLGISSTITAAACQLTRPFYDGLRAPRWRAETVGGCLPSL